MAQHYGYRYDYTSKSLSSNVQPIPDWLKPLMGKLDSNFDQVIINKYEPGQGISAHTDHTSLFGDTVVSISLCSATTMTFTKPGKLYIDLRLNPRSALWLQKDSRYKWKHEIPSRMSDSKVPRRRRISITFRKIRA